MQNRHYQLLWIAWIATGEELNACWTHAPTQGQCGMSISLRCTGQLAADAPERREQMMKRSSASRVNICSMGRGDTFCTICCDAKHPLQRNVLATAFVGYDLTGRITCIGIPNPYFGDALVMELQANRFVTMTDLSSIIPDSRVPHFTDCRDAPDIDDLLSSTPNRFRVDANTSRLVPRKRA